VNDESLSCRSEFLDEALMVIDRIPNISCDTKSKIRRAYSRLQPSLEIAFTRRNISSSFEESGMFPLSMPKILSRFPVVKNLTQDEVQNLLVRVGQQR